MGRSLRQASLRRAPLNGASERGLDAWGTISGRDARLSANDGQVLVRMRTVGVNPLDNTFRSGHHYAATPENLPRVGGQMGVSILENLYLIS
jgi:hypothetical protein